MKIYLLRFKPYTAITILAISATALMSCKSPQSRSSPGEIFSEPQRVVLAPSAAPYILSTESKCTAFVIDTKNSVAMSAEHCGLQKGDSICFGANSLDWLKVGKGTECPNIGKVGEILESSPFPKLDYVLFRFTLEQPAPDMKALRLVATDNLTTIKERETEVQLVGYPVDGKQDGLQQGQLAKSTCKIRSGARERSIADFAKKAIDAWEKDASYRSNDKEYQAMRKACNFLTTDHLSLTIFKHECTVFAGNSGGPLLINDVALGMPLNYFSGPNVSAAASNVCYEQYWDRYFKPIFGERRLDDKAPTNWDSLDRKTINVEYLPEAVPISVIVENSTYLQKNLTGALYYPTPLDK